MAPDREHKEGRSSTSWGTTRTTKKVSTPNVSKQYDSKYPENSPKALSRLSMSSMKKAASRRPAGADLVPQPSLAAAADDSRKGSHILNSEIFLVRVSSFVVDITVVVAVRARATSRPNPQAGDDAVFALPIHGGVGVVGSALRYFSPLFCRFTLSLTPSLS